MISFPSKCFITSHITLFIDSAPRLPPVDKTTVLSTGIPKEILRDNLDNCIRIPTNDKIRSLNVSNVAAVAVFEALRQQNYEGLSEFEPETLKGKDWLLKD